MKGWHAQHKGKWYRIRDVEDTGKPAHEPGGGNVYHLEGLDEPVHQSKIEDMDMQPRDMKKREDKIPGGLADKKSPKDFDADSLKAGIKIELEHTSDRSIAQEIAMDHLIEDPKYYEKLKEVEKYDRVDEEADGKKELDYGPEELEKLKDRWKKLKKALDSNVAIMDLDSQEFHDDDQDGVDDDQEMGGQAGEQGEEEDPAGRDAAEGNESGNPEDELDGMEQDQPDEGSGDLEELETMLRDEGYSDAEIAYIVHGHVMPQATVDDIKMDGEKQSNEHDQNLSDHELEHKKRMSDLEYDTAKQEQGINDLDKEHKKRMLDLEYESAKKEKEMELEFKQKELEAKLDSQREKAEHQLKMKKDADKSRQQDAAKTSKKEKAGK